MPQLLPVLVHSASDQEAIQKICSQSSSDNQVVPFQLASELLKSIQEKELKPWLIFLSREIEGPMSAFDILTQIKLSPMHHFFSVCMIHGPGLLPADKAQDLKNGVFGHLSTPINADELTALLEKRQTQKVEYSDLLDLDKSFSEEMLDLLAGVQDLSHLNEKKMAEVYRVLHTVKGVASSLQFPTISTYVHRAEGFLNTIKAANLYTFQEAVEILENTFKFLEEQSSKIREGKTLTLAPSELLQKMDAIDKKVQSGWKLAPVQELAVAEVEQKDGSSLIVSRTATSVRISNDNLDKLHQQLKKVVQCKSKLRSFASRLKDEFFDEAFPNDLIKISDELTEEMVKIMDFFISLRVVSANRIKIFAEKIFQSSIANLPKKAKIEINSSAHFEIDTVIVECLENGLTHLIRNSLDHGMETPDVRLKNKKPEEGTIKVTIEKLPDDQVKITVQDDGQGINAQKLKEAMKAKGIMDPSSVDQLTDDKALDLIFVDGLSTKETVTDMSGRGVGLGAVKQAINKLGGNITVSTKMGYGTTFEILVPRLFRL